MGTILIIKTNKLHKVELKEHFLILLTILFSVVSAQAQSIDSLQYIDEVEVAALKKLYLIGNKTQNLDSSKIANISGGSLAELLQDHVPLYVKQNAGGTSNIRFRGTAANHNAILFDGINLNSLTLGHSNISNISPFLFDNVLVQYGSSSSLYGSDAIGGTIHLETKQEWNKDFGIEFQQDIGSFSNYFSGLKLKYSNQKFNYKLKLYVKSYENSFPFVNLAAKDFSTGELYRDTLQNAALKNKGLLQDINFKISKNLIFFSKLWVEDNFHEVQPNMSANFYGGGNEVIQDKHIRSIFGIHYYKGHQKFNLTTAYVKDHQVYNTDTENIISTKSFVANLNYFHGRIFKGILNTGLNFSTIQPDVHAYQDGIKENRLELFSSYKKIFFSFAEISLNIRESMVSDYKSQFTPSIATSVMAIERESYQLKFTGSASKGYKIPTFNDRYWYPSGNPNLLPEISLNYEVGTDFKLQKNNTEIKLNLSAYLMRVDNWIEWIQFDEWRPVNRKKVESKGGEASINIKTKFGNFYIQNSANYSLTQATLIESYHGDSDKVGLQLQYTPKHLANYSSRISYKKSSLQIGYSYTGERLTGDKFNEEHIALSSYSLFYSSIGKEFQIKNHHLAVNFRANNLLNTAYQNQELYAMPGRNYRITIKYFINNIKLNKNEQI